MPQKAKTPGGGLLIVDNAVRDLGILLITGPQFEELKRLLRAHIRTAAQHHEHQRLSKLD